MQETPAQTPADDQFWGEIAPINVPIMWHGNYKTVRYHLLTVQEERQITAFVKTRDPKDDDEKNFLTSVYRMATAMLSVDGKAFDMEWGRKVQIIEGWPAILLDAVLGGYESAMILPFVIAEEIATNPNSEPAPGGNGTSSGDAGSTTGSF